MGILSKLFQNINAKKAADYYENSARSTPFNKDLYEQETVRAIIDCIATHTAKAQVQHVVIDGDGRIKEIKRNSPYAKMLNQSPNRFMSGFDFKYRLITQLECRNTAMVYVKWNGMIPEYMIPVDYSNFEIYKIADNSGYAVKFADNLGKTYILNADDVIIIRKFYNNNDISGDGNGCLYNSLNMVKASDEGFIDSLAIANKVRGIHKHKKAMLDPRDVMRGQSEFTERFEKAAKSGGIISIDSQEDYIPLNVSSYSANAAQMRAVRDNLFTYFRTPECIVKSDYSEQQGMAWYEGVVEPLWKQLSEAFTNGLFTVREKDCGNRILFTGGVLLGTSYQTRVNIISQAKETGLLTINEQRELLGYSPIENGDVRQVSLNYVNSDKQNEYQGVGGEKNEEE